MGRDTHSADHTAVWQSVSKPSSLEFLLTLGEAAGLAGGCSQLSYLGPSQAPALVYPHEPKRLPLTALPASTNRGLCSYQQLSRGTSNEDVYAKPRLHKLPLPPRDESLKQTVLPYARSTGASAPGIPRRKHESGWGSCLSKSHLGEIPLWSRRKL